MLVTVDGHEVYAYTGTRAFDPAKPALVFVHGAANDHSVWALQSRYFAHHGYNVLALDLSGHGRSAGPPLPSVEAIAWWILLLLDSVGTGDAAIIGHSLGALVALECAARHPRRVSRVALLGAAVPMQVSDDLLAAAQADDHVAYELINGWSYSAAKQLGGNQVPGIWMTGTALRLMERTRPGVLHTDLAACHRYENGLRAAVAAACPTLVILGARDIMAPPKAAQELLATLRGARVVMLPNTGHAMMAEQPDAVLDALRAFLQGD